MSNIPRRSFLGALGAGVAGVMGWKHAEPPDYVLEPAEFVPKPKGQVMHGTLMRIEASVDGEHWYGFSGDAFRQNERAVDRLREALRDF